VKNMPYATRSTEDNIPFWAQMPYHLKYVAAHKEHLELILYYMYPSKIFQGLFGKAAFYYKNLGQEASASEWNTLAQILTRHIAMVHSMNKVILKGITHIDWRFKLTRWDKDNPQEVDLEVMRSVREIMMEKRVSRTKAWILIPPLHNG
jgi:hypothetical protein